MLFPCYSASILTRELTLCSGNMNHLSLRCSPCQSYGNLYRCVGSICCVDLRRLALESQYRRPWGRNSITPTSPRADNTTPRFDRRLTEVVNQSFLISSVCFARTQVREIAGH
jgi:hypothetical protein